jgi:hypothetical protein
LPIVGVDGEPEALRKLQIPTAHTMQLLFRAGDDTAAICVNEVFNKLNGNELSTKSDSGARYPCNEGKCSRDQSYKYPDLFE